MTLTEFLLARIAEDEAVASAAAGLGGAEWKAFHTLPNDFEQDKTADGIWFVGGEYVLWETEGSSFMGGRWEHMVHIATWNPARVLAECEAKRAIIEDQLLYPFLDAKTAGPFTSAPSVAGLRILKALALPYADHPDYREEWL